MSPGDYEYYDGKVSRGGLTFAVARKLFNDCKHPQAQVRCEGKPVLFRVAKQ